MGQPGNDDDGSGPAERRADGGVARSSCVARVGSAVAWSIALASGVAHFLENKAYVQHLSRVPEQGLAQAASLQTENAFYYSYYHELVEAESAAAGLEEIIWDKRSEYPDVLNAMRRFNIYQEVLLALIYRVLRSCRLLGLVGGLDAWHFFRYTMLLVNGFGHSALSLLASEVSGNPFAGFACFLLAFLNRFEISRVGNYTSSNLRECWGIPLLWAQTLCLWRLLIRRREADKGGAVATWWLFGFLTFVFIVSWQFSPFLLLLQTTALYFVYLVCGFGELLPLVSRVIDVYIATLVLAVVVHFGSPYLVTSPFVFQLVALKFSTTARLFFRRVPYRGGAAISDYKHCVGSTPRRTQRLCSWILGRFADVCEGLVAVAIFLAVRKAMEPFATADTHVYEILCTKVAAINDLLPKTMKLSDARMPECSEPSFNARLYLIMGVFNLLEASSLRVYSKSSAGLMALIASALILLRFVLSSFGFECAYFDVGSGGHAACPGQSTAVSDLGIGPSSVVAASDEVIKTTPAVSANLRQRHTKGHARDGGSGDGGSAVVAGASGSRATSTSEMQQNPLPTEASSDSDQLAALLFFLGQSVLFFGLGGLVNRLRVAFGPPMMVLAASSFGPRLWPSPRCCRKLLVMVMAVMHCVHVAWLLGQFPCLGDGDGICNLFSDKNSQEGDMADLADWINRRLDPRVPILSSMNLAGNLRLFTRAPLIIHPQFESLNLRKRVQLGYELYQCGSETSFVQTMQRLSAEVVIFEYARCFFTPYILDDRRKNCIQAKHKSEDQLCVKLHAQSTRFELLFANGGYGLFRLRPNAAHATTSSEAVSSSTPPNRRWQPPKQEGELSPTKIKDMLASDETWSPYVAKCAEEQGDLCGPRLMELAATWHHTMKRPAVAQILRTLAMRRFPKDGFVNFYYGRHLDYESPGGQMEAGAYYAKAIKALPDNTVILKEYIMWIDMVAKDTQTAQTLLEERRGEKQRRGRPTPLLLQRGCGAGGLLCEAAVSARNLGMNSFGNEMWTRALTLAPFSDCVRNNWQLVHGESSNFSTAFTRWDKVRWMFQGRIQHEVGTHNQPNIRFLGNKPLLTNPFAAGTAALGSQ